MQTKYGFKTMSLAEFDAWLKDQNVIRVIKTVQIHHTFIPSYKHWTGSNQASLQYGMQTSHKARGFSDIAQHFTIYPDGTITTGRQLNIAPAGIYGQNARAICIECIGNFDKGGDEMTTAQAETIIQVTARLCFGFGIIPSPATIQYHHWYDMKTGARTDGAGNTKSCPGSAFFGGNTVEAATKNFIPKVTSATNAAWKAHAEKAQ